MKAIYSDQYGTPEKVLQLKEVAKPIPKPNEVLIGIKATTINDYDWGMCSGNPKIYRLLFGISKPKFNIAGMELAGVVEAVGTKVKDFKVGDEVFGDISDHGFGTFAEYIAVDEKVVRPKPQDLSFVEAAAIPHAATLAWQGLVTLGKIKKGENVLINGGGGGVGTIAVQIAKMFDCQVTGVDAAEKHGMMRSMGFDQVLDYREKDFTKMEERYDLILDCKTNRSAFSYLRPLHPTGRYVTVGGQPGKLISILFWGTLNRLFSKKRLQILALKPNEGLTEILEAFQNNQLKNVIDGPHDFEEIPRLVQHFGAAAHQGKVVIKVAS